MVEGVRTLTVADTIVDSAFSDFARAVLIAFPALASAVTLTL